MNPTSKHRARQAAVVAVAFAAVPALLPGTASAHHQCAQSETYVTVAPGNLSEPVGTGNQMPVWNTCGPHQVSVLHTESDGARNEIAVQQGEMTYTRTEAEREPATSGEPAANGAPAASPPQESRPARRAKRRCRSSRRARERGASERGAQRAARRCRSRNRRR